MNRNKLRNMSNLLALWAAVLLTAMGTSATTATGTGIYEDGQVVVKLNPGHTIEEVNGNWGTTTIDAFPEGNLYLLDATGLGDVEALAIQMATDPAVLEAEANYFQDTPEGVRYMLVDAIGGSYVDYEDQEITARIGLDQALAHATGFGVTVAVL
ncbi:MAG: hypothetical protein KC729_20335, partial [Candidatus Eisenbacteria bacterium]|nr:hypothetical protein [Candidatus Eisenbacteria bacterium]